jgi:hypothetical protein
MPATSRIRTTAQGKRVAQVSAMPPGGLPERRARRIRWRCGCHRSRYMGQTPVGADKADGPRLPGGVNGPTPGRRTVGTTPCQTTLLEYPR